MRDFGERGKINVWAAYPTCIISCLYLQFYLVWDSLSGLSTMCPAGDEYADSRLRSISRFTLRPDVR